MINTYFGGFTHKPDRSDTFRYMKGWCGYFALALHDLYGLEIMQTYGHYANRSENGKLIDIRGVMDKAQFQNGIGSENPVATTRENLIEELKAGIYRCGYYDERELEQAKKLARKLVPGHSDWMPRKDSNLD